MEDVGLASLSRHESSSSRSLLVVFPLTPRRLSSISYWQSDLHPDFFVAPPAGSGEEIRDSRGCNAQGWSEMAPLVLIFARSRENLGKFLDERMMISDRNASPSRDHCQFASGATGDRLQMPRLNQHYCYY